MRIILLFIFTLFHLVSFSQRADKAYCIYGKIIDGITGEILNNVHLSVSYNGINIDSSHITDGHYEFSVYNTGIYEIKAHRVDYYTTTNIIELSDKYTKFRYDIILEKPLKFLELRKNGEEIESFDLRQSQNPDTYAIELFNDGDYTIRFITGSNRDWISDFRPSSGSIEPDETVLISFRINPDKFEAGETSGKIAIISDYGNKILTIYANGEYPTIRVLPIQEMFPSFFEGEIIFNGHHTYYDRGFCFSTTNEYPTVCDNCVSANDFGGLFIYRDIWNDTRQFPWIGNLDWASEYKQKWYVRAYLRYEDDIIIYSENVETFTLWNLDI